MKSRIIAQLVIVSLLGTSVAAFAQPQNDDHRGDDHRGGPPSHDMRGQGHGGPGRSGPREADVGRQGGPIPHNDWHKGDRLPPEYRDRSYVVDNWREHGLHAPPRGYQWVGVNGDYVLAAVASGVIASVLLSGH